MNPGGKTELQKVEEPEAGRSSQASGTQTLLRGLVLLELVADGVSDAKAIAAKLGVPRSTAHRMLGRLSAEGYLHHVPYKGYLLGPKLIHLGAKALEQRPLVALARPHIEALAESTGDTVHLGVLEDMEVFYLDKVPGTRGLEMRSRIGLRMPVASTGLGKALMLGLPRARWRSFYDLAVAFEAQAQDRPPLMPWPAFEEALAGYVGQGWSYDLEENEIGIRCVGAPVWDVRGALAASISIASAVPYMPDERMATLGPLVRATADAISRELGWRAG